jgi:Tfp pilus assembly protein PilZ
VADDRDTGRSLKRVTVRFGPEKPMFTGFTKNLSSTGIFLKTPKVFKPGTVLHLELRLQERRWQMKAVVIWARTAPANLALVLESGMGLQFLDPTPEWQRFNRELKG